MRTVIVMALCALPTAAHAGLVHPASWRQVSDDNQFVLVMVSPLPVDEDAGHPAYDNDEIRDIRAKYTESGLYRNDGSATPLWKIAYHNWTHQAFLDKSGKHLVIADDDWFDSYGHVATFYAGGVQLASYSMTDLFSSIRMRCSVSYVQCRSVDFDTERLTLTTSTDQGDVIVFDATTGQIVEQSSMAGYIALAVSAILAAVVASLVLMRRETASRGVDEG